MPANAAFVHFGLPKCGSTFLQSVWTADPGYAVANLGQAAEAVRKLARERRTTGLPALDLKVQPPAGTALVATSEGFSWAFTGEPELHDRLPLLHEISAAVVGQPGISDTALFLVRNPVDWIRAAHEQTIKEGGFASGREFLATHRAFVLGVLDLAHIRSVYERWFDRVVFLSADEMRTDPERFWSRYVEVLGAPRPKAETLDAVAADRAASNVSLRERTVALARLNAQIRRIVDTWTGLEGLPRPVLAEREQLLPVYGPASQWVARRIAEFAPDEALAELVAGTPELEPDFLDLPLDDGLRAELRSRFCDALEACETIEPEILAEYRAALA